MLTITFLHFVSLSLYWLSLYICITITRRLVSGCRVRRGRAGWRSRRSAAVGWPARCLAAFTRRVVARRLAVAVGTAPPGPHVSQRRVNEGSAPAGQRTRLYSAPYAASTYTTPIPPVQRTKVIRRRVHRWLLAIPGQHLMSALNVREKYYYIYFALHRRYKGIK